MKKVFSLFTLIVFTAVSYGQPSDNFKKNSIGLDFVPIVQNMVHSDSLIPYSIVYRRFITPNHGVRLRLDFGFIKDNDEMGEKPFETTQWAFGFAAGYQYTVSLAKWADILFAFDVGALWERKKSWDIRYLAAIFPDAEPWMLINIDEKYEHWRVVVSPTVELQLKWTHHLSLGLAVSPQYSYRHNYAESSYYSYSDITGDIRSRGWSLLAKNTKQSITPYYNIFLSYNF